MASQFEIGRTYQPKNGSEKDRITVVDRDERYIHFTRPWVQNMIFREKYWKHPDSETLLQSVWTSSDDLVE